MEKNKENRQAVYFEKFSSETFTLAQCTERHDAQPDLTSAVDARIRITKEDRRLPLYVVIAFEPEGGNPDQATIVATATPSIVVAELRLLNRSYVPIVRDIGNPSIGGSIAFPSREGTLGLSLEIHPDCDAVDIKAHLLPAMGALKSDRGTERWGGRWSVGFGMTCVDRLSREEWIEACQRIHMSVQLSSTSTAHTPVLTSNTGRD